MKLKKIVTWSLAILLGLAALFAAAVWLTTFHPDERQPEPVSCDDSAPMLQPGQTLKVMSWNVQYMAGKNYVFFYDLWDGSGPDERPSSADIAHTVDEVARIIRDEDPDVLLIQELDDGAARTDGADQLALLTDKIGSLYPCSTAAFYWKAAFVPHPRIMGSSGAKLAVLSKYRIDSAERHSLPAISSDDIVTRQFNYKRAILAAYLPIEGGGSFAALNTHLSAFAQGSPTMALQIEKVLAVLAELDGGAQPWVIGGDFNLLPAGARGQLAEEERRYYNEDTELATLYAKYRGMPSAEDTRGPDAPRWFTHYPNDPAVSGPDRTIDYLFLSDGLGLGEHSIRQHDTLTISDHLPVIADLTLPE